MYKALRNFIVLAILGFHINALAQSDHEIELEISTYLDQLTADDFSGTILVAREDQILEERAYGLANREFELRNAAKTKFNIASITKMFTAVAMLQLVEKGKAELHGPVGNYLPNYPNPLVRDSVTVHQLLTHTSGLNNFYVEGFLETDKLRFRTVEDFAALFVKDSLLFSPGTDYAYSGAGFVVLGMIIEEVSGQDYYKYLKRNLFEPSRMYNTTELEIDSIVPNKASGYTSQFGKNDVLKRNDYYLSKASPGGFHYSTVADLHKFSQALRNYRLLSKEMTELMFAPKVKGYNTHIGYGIDVDQRYNQTILGHSGGWYGVRAELMYFVEDDYTIVVLSNVDDDGRSGASQVVDFFKELIADKQLEAFEE